MTATGALIALDWGTTRLRASLLDAAGRLLESRSSPAGIMSIAEQRFEEALRALCGDWLDGAPCPVVASGMIGSRNGWREAPYVPCPASLHEASGQLTRIDLGGGRSLHIAPGLRCVGADGVDDVMRGEETQVWGARLSAGAGVILPGTHSKWVSIGSEGRIDRFQTWMTGELYGLWTQHGLLGRLMTFGYRSPDDFAAGVRLGLAEFGNAHHVIFGVRTAGLLGRVAPEGLPDYLSGLLIGIEIGAATQAGSPFMNGDAGRRPGGSHEPWLLIGEADLCDRYEAALAIAGWPSARADDHVTLAGQWALARAAGLVEEPN